MVLPAAVQVLALLADLGPVNALRTNDAGGIQVVAHAVAPAVVPQFVGLMLYRFDVTVRTSQERRRSSRTEAL